VARSTANSRVRIVRDSSSFRRENTTQFYQSKIAQKNPQLVLNSDLPLSERRDDITEENNATITKVTGEYRLRATSDTDSRALLRTRQRGNYLSGSVLEVGLGVRIPTQPTGDAIIRWGYFDDNDGIYYKYDSDGVCLKVRKGGSDVLEVRQKDWNLDTLDGSGPNQSNPSGSNLNLADGAIFQIPFAYYGYGAIDWEVGISDFDNDYFVRSVHQENMQGTTIDEPNLPLAIEVDSGTSGQQLDCFVGGRQISPLGSSDNLFRTTEGTRLSRAITDTAFRPVISFRHKTGFENIFVRLGAIDFISDSDGIFELQRNATLSGDSFTYTGNQTEAEKAVEIDVSAGNTYTNGEAIYRGTFEGGTGSKITAGTADLPQRPISELDTIALAAKTLTGSGTLEATILKIQEDW